MNLMLAARWKRFWHCLRYVHQAETLWEGYPIRVRRVRCYSCGKEWK